jgi:hypothetical protein
MANRNFGNQNKSNLQQPVRISFQWTQDAGAAPQVVRGRNVTSVTRTALGLYSVVFDDNYYQLYGVNGIVVGAAANLDLYVQVAAYNPAAAGGATLDLRLKTGAAQADPALNDEVFIECVWSNSQLNL